MLSFGTAGCNLACKFCQNWDISKSREMDTLQSSATPGMIAVSKPYDEKPATAGNGSMGHLFGEQFRAVAGLKLLQVPYKGAAPGLADVMGGSVDVAIMSVPSVLGLVKGGKLTPLAVTTTKRAPLIPDVPTMQESGVAGYKYAIWSGLLAPAKTPRR